MPDDLSQLLAVCRDCRQRHYTNEDGLCFGCFVGRAMRPRDDAEADALAEAESELSAAPLRACSVCGDLHPGRRDAAGACVCADCDQTTRVIDCTPDLIVEGR